MRILIADDSEQDRKKLRQMIAREMPECEIDGAENIREMYAKLSIPCDFLFHDVSLAEPEEPGSDGFVAVYDIIDSFPDLAIAIVTNRFFEKVHEFHDAFLGGKANQIVGFLDKLSFSEEDIVRVFVKADDFKEKVTKEREEKQEIEALFDDMLKDEEARIQKKMEAIRKDGSDDVSAHKLYIRAFSGTNWISRIEAEIKITGKYCNTNAILLCRELESLVKQLFTGSHEQCRTFYEKMQWIIGDKGLPDELYISAGKAWKIRNSIVHAEKNATKQDAVELAACFQLLEKV
jgi:hypothetical protein